MVSKAIFLDRDGVINKSIMKDGKPHAPRKFSDFKLFPGVVEAIKNLSDAGYLIFVATNQPDIGNKLVDPNEVEKMHAYLMEKLPIKEIYMCPHRQDENCECRKPKPGMLFAAKNKFNIDMSASFMVGDRYSDVQTSLAAGCTPVFVDHDYLETPDFDVNMRFQSLVEASARILERLERK